MAIKHLDEYRDPKIAKQIAGQICKKSKNKVRIMEVCGTHTMSIFRNGIRSLLPDTIDLLSGPGCPVCVTAQEEIDTFIEVSRLENVIIASFGDLLKVPGAESSLMAERADGKDIRIVYSTFDALDLARKHPDKKIVFPGVGFETTAPVVAATILKARQENLDNFMVISAHKRVPPALDALMNIDGINIDGFLLPGHVSVIIGMNAYGPVFNKFKIPCVAAGFEPGDILYGILMLIEQIEENRPKLENAYPRAVTADGNPQAVKIMEQVFDITEANWRGIGQIHASGLAIKEEFAAFDARKRLDFTLPDSKEPKGCACGEILTGMKIPPECGLYKKRCTPVNPVGPCMVSSEGTCAAYYRYWDG
ncbi:hydrogenase formation protein HypD [Desulfobacterales bacterium HSG16]|nr:hydrogenase formation protein HypD [Desulfobacterales bacterium HSG16]